MFTVTYSNRRGFQDYITEYQIIESFAGEILSASDKFIKEILEELSTYLDQRDVKIHSNNLVYDLLFLGSLWRIYFYKNSITKKKSVLPFKNFINIRKRDETDSTYSSQNLEMFFKWLELTREFKQELTELNIIKEFFESQNPKKFDKYLRKTLIFVDWFNSSSRYAIGDYRHDLKIYMYNFRLIGAEITKER